MSPSNPSVSSAHYDAYLNIALMFGFQKPGGESSWKTFSGDKARATHNQLIAVFGGLSQSDSHGGIRRVMTLFAVGHLPRFIDLYLDFVRDVNTLIPFSLMLFSLALGPYLGFFIRQYDNPQLLIRHQIRVLLSNGLHRLQSTAFATISEVNVWAFEVSNVYKLAVYLRTLLYHISRALDVPNPIISSPDTSSLIEAIEKLLPSLKHRLEVPFDRATIIGTRPNRVAYKQFTEEVKGLRGKLNDALLHLRLLLPLPRAEADADARISFKVSSSSSSPYKFPENTCAFAMGHCEVTMCESSELKACSKCRAVVYCSKDHQKQHWKCHKDACFGTTWLRRDSGEASGNA